MDKKIITKAAVIVLLTTGVCAACCESEKTNRDVIETILRRLNRQVSNLNSYQCRIEYLFSQPLFESKTLRTGVLYYKKAGGKSALRIDFRTLAQDDEKSQKYIERYIFDGVWLTVIDYQIKTVKMRQLAEPNEPVDAFELAGRNFPIIGFTGTEDLRKQFEIKLVVQEETEPSQLIQLHLKVKPDSVYKDDYTSIDFWIDRRTALPAKIASVSTEGDIYRIKLLAPKINKRIDKKVFEVRIPEGFTVEKRKTQDSSLRS